MRLDLDEIKALNRSEVKTLLISILIGLVVAPLILSLPEAVGLVHGTVIRITDLPGGNIWLLLPILIAGLLIGLLTRKIAPEIEGPGLHVAAAAYHSDGGRLRARSVPFKFLATLITLGAGATNGIVGPSALIGYSFGSSAAYRLGLDKEKIRTLALCGMAAAISALLETPLGAAVFAAEIAYRDKILYKRFFYSLVSSTTAFLVSINIRPVKPLLDIPGELPTLYLTDLLTMFLIAISVTMICILYIWFYQGFHDRFRRMDWKGYGWLKPAFGFLLAGLIMVPAFSILQDLGYLGGFSGKLISLEDFDVWRMTLVALVLFITTAIIAASGNSGGLFMPIMAFGGIFGVIIASFFSDTDPLVFAAVGMAAAISTTLNVPLAAAIIIMELFGLPVFLPSIMGALAGYFIGKRHVIYHEIRWEHLRK
ncbi:MAG: chloride channel protein [Candidatus Thermoplasmatota archaeon]|nr:chloride channel protein [Candidatus Thermoplasmatota archaeon]